MGPFGSVPGPRATAWLVAFATMTIGAAGVSAEVIVGDTGRPVSTPAPGRPGITVVNVIPAIPVPNSNCIPFGDNTDFGFTGFMYRNVPPFSLMPGSTIAFDLGATVDHEARRDIYLSPANINPATPQLIGADIVSQGIHATAWTKVVSETQLPQNPFGNFIAGDYELIYTIEQTFVFSGGGLLVGFAGSPPAAIADPTCDGVIIATDANDPSNLFYGRFFYKPHLTLDVIDTLESGGGNGIVIGGMVIREETTPVRSRSWAALKLHYR